MSVDKYVYLIVNYSGRANIVNDSAIRKLVERYNGVEEVYGEYVIGSVEIDILFRVSRLAAQVLEIKIRKYGFRATIRELHEYNRREEINKRVQSESIA